LPRYALAHAVHDPEGVLGIGVALLRRFARPLQRQRVVLSDAVALLMGFAQCGLRTGVSRLRFGLQLANFRTDAVETVWMSVAAEAARQAQGVEA